MRVIILDPAFEGETGVAETVKLFDDCEQFVRVKLDSTGDYIICYPNEVEVLE